MLQHHNEAKARDRAILNELAEIRAQGMEIQALRKEFKDFQKHTESGVAHLSAQLSEIVAYINRGGNDKKGEVSSSRPQPPPDDQGRGGSDTGCSSGGIRTTTIVERFDDEFYRRERESRNARRGRGGRRRSHVSGSGRSMGYWLGEK
ncbi:hypothetical protein F511_45603 [Dorcoceras hygrometricum]|nr:hypothetical protein F511_45603 [Dorcoceras hygrometricum]